MSKQEHKILNSVISRNLVYRYIITIQGKYIVDILVLDQLVKYYIREHFTEKYAENVHQKIVQDLYVILISSSKYTHCTESFI